MKIKDIIAREILDSRGNPTVSVKVILEDGTIGVAAVPSGASTGEKEALELRDNDKERYLGKGVLTAVNNVNTVLKYRLIGMDVTDQVKIDNILINLDGTKSKSKYGANAILGVSMAVLKAAANYYKMPLYKYIGGVNAKVLPTPMMNVLNGGSHADSTVDFQEYMIMPISAYNFKEAIRMGSEVFHHLKNILKANNHITSVGDEGGFAPNFINNEEPLKYLLLAVKEAGYIPGKDFVFALDVAASEFYDKKDGLYKFKNGESLKGEDLINYYEYLLKNYPIVSIEDGLDENDEANWIKLSERLNDKMQNVGDDLFVTNPLILKNGILKGIGNSILIKLNQIGTVTEAFDTIELAKKNGYTCIISHRSGETEDTTIADIAVGLNLGQIKTGSLSRTDRIAKYNRLMEIEDELGYFAEYQGIYSLKNLKNR